MPDEFEVQITWKSFQLDPVLKRGNILSSIEYLAKRYGKDLSWSETMHRNVAQMAADEGLEFNFDSAKVANTFDAHRLMHLAKTSAKSAEISESLFRSHFVEGGDLQDIQHLTAIAEANEISSHDVSEGLKGIQYNNAVRQDIAEAQQLGISGVPFFVFNRKYAISGAQPVDEFVEVINACLQD